MIVIVDFGMGNLRSIQHKLEKSGVTAVISSKEEDISKAAKIILPGVGHYFTGIKNLKEYNLIEILNKKALDEKIPILGICLGMQLFTKHSEEGNVDGLGWINAETKKFDFKESTNKLKVPHVGWNNVSVKKDSALFSGVDIESRFYFTHSYYVECTDPQDIIAITDYGHDFVSAVQKNNIYGTQFHPEKSHINGFNIIKNFIKM